VTPRRSALSVSLRTGCAGVLGVDRADGPVLADEWIDGVGKLTLAEVGCHIAEPRHQPSPTSRDRLPVSASLASGWEEA